MSAFFCSEAIWRDCSGVSNMYKVNDDGNSNVNDVALMSVLLGLGLFQFILRDCLDVSISSCLPFMFLLLI